MVFAMLHPKRTLSVTCIGSAEPHPAGGEPTFRSIARAWAGRARERALQDGPEAALEMLGSAKLLGKIKASASTIRVLHLAMEGYAADDLLSTVPARRIDTEAGARGIRCPVMFLAGEEDPFLTECRYAHDRIQGSRLVVLPACGHMVPLEAPEKVAAALLDFLA
jgi:pimeloyl-ACP methyl ester carboxylesterase